MSYSNYNNFDSIGFDNFNNLDKIGFTIVQYPLDTVLPSLQSCTQKSELWLQVL